MVARFDQGRLGVNRNFDHFYDTAHGRTSGDIRRGEGMTDEMDDGREGMMGDERGRWASAENHGDPGDGKGRCASAEAETPET